MTSFISDEATYKQLEQVGSSDEYAQLKEEIIGAIDLSDYKARRQFFRDLSQDPIRQLMWKAIQTFESQPSDLKVISQSSILLMYRDIQNAPEEAEILNANALLMAYEYISKLQSNLPDRDFQKWLKEFKTFGTDIRVMQKSKEKDFSATSTPVFLFDVVRYARYIAETLQKSDDLIQLLLDPPHKISLIKSSSESGEDIEASIVDEEKCSRAFTPPLEEEKCLPPTGAGVATIQIEDGPQIQLALYEYDTIGSIRLRTSLQCQVPQAFLRYDREFSNKDDTEIKEQIFGNTKILFHNITYKKDQSPYADKTIVFKSVYHQAQKVVLSNPEGNVRIELDEYFDQLKDSQTISIVSSEKFERAALLELLKHAKLPYATLAGVSQSVAKAKSSQQTPFYKKIANLGAYVLADFKETSPQTPIMKAFFGTTADFETIQNDVELQCKIFSKYINVSKDEHTSIMSDHKQTDYRISGTYVLRRTDAYEVFNRLQCNRYLPFARVGKFVKVINNMLVPKDWTRDITDESLKDVCEFYVKAVSEEPTIVVHNGKQTLAYPSEFVKCSVKEEKHEGTNSHFSFEIITSNEDAEQIVLSLFISAIQPPSGHIEEIHAKRTFAGGVTIINNLSICPYKFYDFAMNNPYVSDTIRINERSNIYRLKQHALDEEKQRMLSGSIKFRIMLSKGSLTYIDADLKINVPEGPRAPERLYFNVPKDMMIWRLDLSGALLSEQVSQLLQKFSSALAIMEQDTSSFFYEWYCKQITDIGAFEAKNTFKSTSGEKYLLTAQDLFVNKYVRSCDAKPIAQKYNKNVYTLLQRAGENPLLYPNDKPKYVLSCPYENKKHIGLIENTTLSNKSTYPWIPCCYETPDDLVTKYKDGLTFAQLTEYSKTQFKDIRSVLVTLKKLSEGALGQLPQRLKKLVSMLDTDEKYNVIDGSYEYLRMGVGGAPELTFVNALERATGKKVNWTRLAEVAQSGLTQSAGMTPQTAYETVTNKRYINPRIFLGVLRKYFEVEIVMFLQDKTLNREGTLGCEYYDRTRLVNRSDKKYDNTVFVYVHRGAEFDDIDEPITDLVIKADVTDSLDRKFARGQKMIATSSNIVQQLFFMLDQLYPTQDVNFPLEGKKVQSQQFDSFGVTRGLQFQYSDRRRVHLYLSGIPNVYAENQTQVVETDRMLTLEEGKGILRDAKLVVFNGEILGLIKMVGGVQTYLPVEPRVYDESLEMEVYDTDLYGYPMPVSRFHKNFSDVYAYYKKLSHFVKYYMYWIFSMFLYSRREQHVDLRVLTDAWCREHIIVETGRGYESEYVKRRFDLENREIIRKDGEKLSLIIRESSERSGEEIKRRLHYILRQAVEFEYDSLVEFMMETYIPDYYTASSMFEKSVNYTVYNSVGEYIRMTHGAKAQYDLKILFEYNENSYYVRVDGMYYLCVPAESVGHAVAIMSSYDERKSVHTSERWNVGEDEVSLYENRGERIELSNGVEGEVKVGKYSFVKKIGRDRAETITQFYALIEI